MQELEVMIEKLLNPVCEIRWRALQNILSKLSYSLINLEDLLSIQSGRMCENLLKWFSSTSYSIPEPNVALTFFLKIIKETSHGTRIMVNLNARHILQVWVTKNLEEKETTDLVRDICSELVTNQKEKIANNQNLEYGESNLSHEDILDSDNASIQEDPTTTSNTSASSPARFLLNNRETYVRSKVPTHLLEPASISSDQKNSTNASKHENRLYSPVSRSYLKRRVTFSQNSESQESENTDILGIDESDIIAQMFPRSTIISEWHTIAKKDREVLDDIVSRITSSKKVEVRSALQELSSFVLEDYPPELLLQRPDIVFAVQDLLILQSDIGIRYSSVCCLERLVQKLQARIQFCSNFGFVGHKNCDILFTESFVTNNVGLSPDSQGI